MDNLLKEEIEKRAKIFASKAKYELYKTLAKKIIEQKATPSGKLLATFPEDTIDVLNTLIKTVQSPNISLNHIPNLSPPSKTLTEKIKGDYIDTILNSIPAMQILLDMKNETNLEA